MQNYISYNNYYDNTLLKSIPRNLNRKIIGIKSDKLPFYGSDIWKLYELSWLNNQGLPQVAIGQVIINSNSNNLIESKSFKLYLNSLNQTKFNSWQEAYNIIQKDLNIHLQSKDIINIELFKLSDFNNIKLTSLLGKCIDNQNIKIHHYSLNANYLINSTSKEYTQETLVSNLLKSNCPMTNQPDWGSIMIDYQGFKINHSNLLRYLISFRQHNEFQEQCIERIFIDIQYYCKPDKLSIYGCYNRRGGLEINSWRSNNNNFIPKILRLVRQ